MDDLMTTGNNLAKAMATLEPAKLPLDIFYQVTRLCVTPVVELVPFYRNDKGNIKVLLFQKDAKDRFWANQYHVPGTIVLATDNTGSFADALTRIKKSLSDYSLSELVYVDTQLCGVTRGTEVAIIYTAYIVDPPDGSLLFSLEELPVNIIEGQEDFIKAAYNKLFVD